MVKCVLIEGVISMAWYKHENILKKSQSDSYDELYEPSIKAPYGGIYHCTHCGAEVSVAEGHVLPPKSHHHHKNGKNEILWQLIIYADSSAK